MMSKLTNNSNNSNSKIIKTIPWEPYKGAVNSELIRLSSQTDDSKNLTHQLLSDKNLVRYKVDTDLTKFNRDRPINDDDHLIAQQLDNQENRSFKDARFYTDYHFIKLANQLKDKTVKIPIDNSILSPKPVNIVTPLTNDDIQSQSTSSIVSLTGLDADTMTPVTLSLWKIQRDQYETRIKQLEEQIKGLYEHLEMQTQVNAELKKLLVASIGDDIQYKIERLVNDKQRFEYELTINNRRLAELSEQIEQISIQCDLWRSKFLACKTMNDELSVWKTFLLMLQNEHSVVIRNLLHEKESNYEKLYAVFKKLSDYSEKIGHKKSETGSSICSNCILNAPNLVLNNQNSMQIVDSIKSLVNQIVNVNNDVKSTKNGDSEHLNDDDDDGERLFLFNPTKHEYIAKQMLVQFSWLPISNPNSIELIETLLNALKMQKTKLISRFDNLNESNFACCSKCRGNIKIV